jgi:pimeloyl-ACP methyl ester carboxylesterase
VQLAYVELGRGDPVVLIHSALADYREWGPQLDALARHHKVIAYSRRYQPEPTGRRACRLQLRGQRAGGATGVANRGKPEAFNEVVTRFLDSPDHPVDPSDDGP